MAGESHERFERICRFGIVNSYLVAEEDELTVIDTALSGTQTDLLAAAERRGLPIRRIVLTHAHSDHVGALDALVAELPEAELLISSREAPLLGGRDKSLRAGEPDSDVRGGFAKVVATPARTLEPGERVGSLEVIASAGHTPGHVALLDRRDGTLFCGDAFVTLGGLATPAQLRLRFPFPYLASWHRPTALRSAAALCELEPQRLAPGHGKVVEAPLAAMRRAVESAA